MKPRTLIAVQFALWAFFFSRIIPFSGTILLPIVWLFDRKVFAVYLFIALIDGARYMPAAWGFPQFQKAIQELPPWIVPFIIPLSLGMFALSISLDVWIGAWVLKRKMKKLAPDLEVIRRHS